MFPGTNSSGKASDIPWHKFIRLMGTHQSPDLDQIHSFWTWLALLKMEKQIAHKKTCEVRKSQSVCIYTYCQFIAIMVDHKIENSILAF